MRFSRSVLIAVQAGALVCSALNPQFASAYDHPLSDAAVREAYFAGQDVRSVNAFLSQYNRALPVPDSGPHVAEIELSTPYAQVVEVSAQHTVGYTAQQAEADYRKRGDSILVRVKVLFTPTYTGDENFWRGVSVGLVQKGKRMAATRLDGQAIITLAACDGAVDIGAYVYAQFNVASVESDSVQVEVVPPAGAPVQARFDLKTLR